MEEHDRYKKKENSKINGGERIFFFLFELQRNLTLTKVPKHKHAYPYIHVQKKYKTKAVAARFILSSVFYIVVLSI